MSDGSPAERQETKRRKPRNASILHISLLPNPPPLTQRSLPHRGRFPLTPNLLEILSPTELIQCFAVSRSSSAKSAIAGDRDGHGNIRKFGLSRRGGGNSKRAGAHSSERSSRSRTSSNGMTSSGFSRNASRRRLISASCSSGTGSRLWSSITSAAMLSHKSSTSWRRSAMGNCRRSECYVVLMTQSYIASAPSPVGRKQASVHIGERRPFKNRLEENARLAAHRAVAPDR